MSTPPLKLQTELGLEPVDMAGSSGEHTPTTDLVTFKARGINIFHRHKDEDHPAPGGDASPLIGSWWGPSARPGNRPWQNSPQ